MRQSGGDSQPIVLVVEDEGHGAQAICALLEQAGYCVTEVARVVCQPNPPVVSVVCSWPQGTAVVPGNYSLQVSAPGYQETTVQVEVTTPPPDQCGCSFDSVTPSTVSISPADGSVD
jgi:hypothetical protein